MLIVNELGYEVRLEVALETVYGLEEQCLMEVGIELINSDNDSETRSV